MYEEKIEENTTFDDLTRGDIDMTEGEIFLSISLMEGVEEDEE